MSIGQAFSSGLNAQPVPIREAVWKAKTFRWVEPCILTHSCLHTDDFIPRFFLMDRLYIYRKTTRVSIHCVFWLYFFKIQMDVPNIPMPARLWTLLGTCLWETDLFEKGSGRTESYESARYDSGRRRLPGKVMPFFLGRSPLTDKKLTLIFFQKWWDVSLKHFFAFAYWMLFKARMTGGEIMSIQVQLHPDFFL